MDEVRNVSNKKPELADIHIGARVKQRRTSIKMSQEELGERLGITFQQVQKYEKGANRIGAGRLFSISEVLGTPVDFFYDGLKASDHAGEGLREGDEQPGLAGRGAGEEEVRLLAAFEKISEPEIRIRILDLVQALAADTAGGPKADRQRR